MDRVRNWVVVHDWPTARPEGAETQLGDMVTRTLPRTPALRATACQLGRSAVRALFGRRNCPCVPTIVRKGEQMARREAAEQPTPTHRPSAFDRAARRKVFTGAPLRAYIITASRASSPFSVPPAHDRYARAAAAAALARSRDRSIARTRCGVGGGGGVRLHRASRARMRTSSPISVPPRTTGTRALWRRSLDRSIARSLDRAHAVWRWRWRWRSLKPRVTYARHARRASRARMRTSSPMSAPPAHNRHARAAAAAALARSLDRARGVWR